MLLSTRKVVDVDTIEKGSDIVRYNVDDVDAIELGADNGVTLKSGDINTTLEGGDIGATYEGGDITEDKSISSSFKGVSKLIS